MIYIKNFIKENKHFLYLLMFIPLLTVFYLCQKFIQPIYIMHCRYDECIPFLKIFIVPYMFWFFYMAIPFIYFGINSKEDFIKLTKFIFGGMSISYLIFIIFPNGQNLRPVLLENDVFSNLIKFIYSIDPPCNVFPSIHVLNSIAVNIIVCKSKMFNEKQLIKIISTIIMILICMSTIFIKQHSLIDVSGGAVLAIFIYIFIYIRDIKSIGLARKTNFR